MKRLLTLVLALVMMMSMASFAMAEEEVLEATAIVFTSPGYTPVKDSYGVNYIKEKFGLYLDIQPVDSGTNESWNTFWAGGGYADVIFPYGRGQLLQLKDEEVLRTYPIEWLKEYAPRIWSLGLKMLASDEESLIKIFTEDDGQCYSIPSFNGTTGIAWVSMLRKDWMEAVGITEEPTTIDELTALFDAFTYGDPDGNGIDDTMAFHGEQYGLSNIAAAFGTAPGLSYYLADDGSVWTNAVTDEWRAYISQYAAWFEAGYCDPEFVTDGRADIRAKLANGKYGMYSDNPWWFENERGEVGPVNMLIASNPAFDWSMVVPFDNVLNANGEKWVNGDYVIPRGQCAVSFGYECPDEVVIKCLQISNACTRLFDGTEEDHEVMITRAEMNNGIEGEHWIWNEGDSAITLIGEGTAEGWIDDRTSKMGLYIYTAPSALNLKPFEGDVDEFVIEMYNESYNTNKIYKGSNVALPTLEGELADIADMVSTTFSTYKTAFILGEKDIDDDAVWAEYLAELESAGLSKVLAAYAEKLAA